MITDISLLDPGKQYNYADYLTWRFEQVVELIKGSVWNMSPSPGTTHQRISMNLTKQFLKYFDPEHQTVHLFFLGEEKKYALDKIYLNDDVFSIQTLPGSKNGTKRCFC